MRKGKRDWNQVQIWKFGDEYGQIELVASGICWYSSDGGGQSVIVIVSKVHRVNHFM